MPSIKSVSAAQSVVSTDKSVMDADGEEVCTVYITANLDFQDDEGQPYPIGGVPASLVVVAVTPDTGVVITQPTGNLSADGTTTATFTSTNATTVSVTATINGLAVTSGATVVVGGSVTPPDPGDPFFEDDFAGAALNSAGGFTWATSPATVSIVTWETRDALRFRFGPNAPGADSSAQQNFNMGRDLDEVWIEYDFWVPTNYVHRNEGQNKFIRLWGTDYNSPNKVGSSTFYQATPGPSYLDFEGQRNTWTGGIGQIDGACRIPYGNDLGVWLQIRQHFKMVTAAENDGVYEIWVDGVLGASVTNLPLNYDATYPYWNQGYLMGWSNSGFAAETDFYLASPKFYDADPGW